MWILYAFCSALFAGLTAVLAKIGIQKINSHLATALRTVVVLVFAWMMVFIVGSQSSISSVDSRSWLFLILSGFATGASWICYFRALQTGDVNKVAPIDKSSTVLTMLLAFLLLREALSLNMLLGMCLIFTGTLLMVTKTGSGGGSPTAGGRWLLWAVLSAVFASLTAILSKIGIVGVDSNLGTAIRTAVVLARPGGCLFSRTSAGNPGNRRKKLAFSRPLRPGDGAFLDVLLPGAAGGTSQRGCSHRQAEHPCYRRFFGRCPEGKTQPPRRRRAGPFNRRNTAPARKILTACKRGGLSSAP